MKSWEKGWRGEGSQGTGNLLNHIQTLVLTLRATGCQSRLYKQGNQKVPICLLLVLHCHEPVTDLTQLQGLWSKVPAHPGAGKRRESVSISHIYDRRGPIIYRLHILTQVSTFILLQWKRHRDKSFLKNDLLKFWSMYIFVCCYRM